MDGREDEESDDEVKAHKGLTVIEKVCHQEERSKTEKVQEKLKLAQHVEHFAVKEDRVMRWGTRK